MVKDSNIEQWKDVYGFEGRYKVSSLGRVYSVSKGKFLKQHGRSKDGRLYVYLWKKANGTTTRYRDLRITKPVHRLVAETFVPIAIGRTHVDHINGIPIDNRASNLRWCTPEENTWLYSMMNSIFRSVIPKTNTREKKEYIKETTEEKEIRLKNMSDKRSKEYGVHCIVDGKQFESVRQATRYIYELEPNRGKEETIRKEVQKVAKGKRKPFKLYDRFTVGY